MALTNDYIEHVLRLAHLHVGEESKLDYMAKLEGVLGMAEKLTQFDIDHLEPTLTLCDGPTPLREDVVIPQENLLLEENAPEWEDNCFKVPKI